MLTRVFAGLANYAVFVVLRVGDARRVVLMGSETVVVLGMVVLEVDVRVERRDAARGRSECDG